MKAPCSPQTARQRHVAEDLQVRQSEVQLRDVKVSQLWGEAC